MPALKLHEALVHHRGARGEVGAEAHPVGVARCAPRTARRSRSSAGTCRRRTPATGPRASIRARVSSKPSTAHGPCVGPHHVGEHAEDAVEVDRVGLDEAVREQVQPQVGVGGVGRRRRRGRSPTCTSSRRTRAHLVLADQRLELGRGGRHPQGRTQGGLGYQVSRTDPSSVMVASPCPQALRSLIMGASLGEAASPVGKRSLDRLPRMTCHRSPAGPRPLRRRHHAHRGAVRHRVGQPRRGGAVPTPSRPPCAPLGAPRGDPRSATRVVARTDLGRAERVVLAGHIDTVPLTTDPANLPTRREGEDLVRPRHGRHEGRRRPSSCEVAAAGPRAVAATSPSSSTRARRSTAEFNGLRARRSSTAPELLDGRLRRPARADRRRQVEGGCKGTLRVEVIDQGRRRPLGPAVEGPQRHPRRGRGARPARRPTSRRPSRRRARVPRGAQRRRHPAAASPATSSPTGASSPSTTATRPSKSEAGGRRPRARAVRRLRRDSRRQRRRRPARAAPARGQGVRRGARACRSTPRRAGPTSPASPRSASRPSTSAPATPTSPTRTTSAARSSSASTSEAALLRWLA